MTATAIASVHELAQLLRDNAAGPRQRVRLRGRGSRPRLCRPAPQQAVTVSLQQLDRIERLEPDDLTCSVQTGVPCRELAAALAARGLELGGLRADDPGTIGGLCATDPLGPPVPGGACPRSTLLGLNAVLADGGEFRSGARVVKSVAGFDVHRLFVGSHGRLFAATLLHLKLRPAPRAQAAFATAPLDVATGVRRFLALRNASLPPRRLVLTRAGDGVGVELAGCFAGRPGQIDAQLRTNDLEAVAREPQEHLAPPSPPRELLIGRVRAAQLAALLAALPATAPFLAHAGGHFETVLPPAVADELLPRLPALGAVGALALASPERVGRSTAEDPGAAALQGRLRHALDPLELLA